MSIVCSDCAPSTTFHILLNTEESIDFQKGFERSGFVCQSCSRSCSKIKCCGNCSFCTTGFYSRDGSCKPCPAGMSNGLVSPKFSLMFIPPPKLFKWTVFFKCPKQKGSDDIITPDDSSKYIVIKLKIMIKRIMGDFLLKW